MMKKPQPRTLDFSKLEVLKLEYHGVPIKVTFDANGWPLASTPACSYSPTDRRVSQAVTGVLDELRRRAMLKAEDEGHARRTATSTETKRKRAAEFWGNDWLAEALPRCPKCRPNSRDSAGDHPLAVAARNMIEERAQHEPEFRKHDHFKHRAQISNYRARVFLENR
jgi:hypothetical protein